MVTVKELLQLVKNSRKNIPFVCSASDVTENGKNTLAEYYLIQFFDKNTGITFFDKYYNCISRFIFFTIENIRLINYYVVTNCVGASIFL